MSSDRPGTDCMTGTSTPARGLVTALCFIMAVIAWGTVFYGHSVYMDQLMRSHGWSASLISSAILVFWIAALPGTLFVGTLVDRFGPPPVVVVGGLCIGAGLLALPYIAAPWQMFTIYAAMGFGYPALAAAAISATLVPWFTRGFGAALGVALTGASVGGAVLPVWIVQSSALQGFVTTMTVLGGSVIALAVAIGIMLALLGRPRPAVGQAADNPAPYAAGAILLQPTFWLIALAAAFGLGGQVGFLAHQVPIIAARFDPVTASLTVTIVAIASALGRLIIGIASRYLAISTLAGLSYLIYGAGLALLSLPATIDVTLAGCAMAGLFVGAIVMLPPILVRDVYGARGFGRTYAMVNVVMYIFAGLTPWLVGLLRDRIGSYTPALWLLIAMEVLAFTLIVCSSRRTNIAGRN